MPARSKVTCRRQLLTGRNRLGIVPNYLSWIDRSGIRRRLQIGSLFRDNSLLDVLNANVFEFGPHGFTCVQLQRQDAVKKCGLRVVVDEIES